MWLARKKKCLLQGGKFLSQYNLISKVILSLISSLIFVYIKVINLSIFRLTIGINIKKLKISCMIFFSLVATTSWCCILFYLVLSILSSYNCFWDIFCGLTKCENPSSFFNGNKIDLKTFIWEGDVKVI